MKTMYLRGGPLNGKELAVNNYLISYQLPCPWGGIRPYTTIEHYQQHPIEKHIYEHVGSRPYYLHGEN